MLAGHIVLLAWRWDDDSFEEFLVCFVTIWVLLHLIDFLDEFLGFLC